MGKVGKQVTFIIKIENPCLAGNYFQLSEAFSRTCSQTK